jgi:hypothetical protein
LDTSDSSGKGSLSNSLESVTAVACDTSAVGFQQNICTDDGIYLGETVSLKYIYHKVIG